MERGRSFTFRAQAVTYTTSPRVTGDEFRRRLLPYMRPGGIVSIGKDGARLQLEDKLYSSQENVHQMSLYYTKSASLKAFEEFYGFLPHEQTAYYPSMSHDPKVFREILDRFHPIPSHFGFAMAASTNMAPVLKADMQRVHMGWDELPRKIRIAGAELPVVLIGKSLKLFIGQSARSPQHSASPKYASVVFQTLKGLSFPLTTCSHD